VKLRLVRAGKIGAALGLTCVLSGCVSSSRSAEDYERKAQNSAEASRSSVETTRLAVEMGQHGDAPSTYLSVLVGEAETDASSVESGFASVQPPDRASDLLRREVGDALHEATDVISDVRIAVRRNQLSDLDRFIPQLDKVSNELKRLSGES